MFEDKLDLLSRMTATHMTRPFPPGFRGLDIEGHDRVMLDTDSCGYAVTVPERSRRPPLTRAAQLDAAADELPACPDGATARG